MQTSSNATQAKAYYTESLNRGDYYKDGQELAGRWGGLLSERLGLSGEVSQRDFFALCENRHPKTSDQLTPRLKDNRRVGYDINFHVPKSVSILYAIGQDERILDAFRNSVTRTMSDLEGRIETRVRVAGQMASRVTANAAWAEFVHATARPVNGIPDPHLHAHCFTFNITHDAVEGRAKAGEFVGMKMAAPYFESLFRLRLAVKLRELGYDLREKGKVWEVDGIGEKLTEEFSRRTSEINKLAKDLGIENDAARKAGLGASTRERKQKEHSMSDLRSDWESRAGKAGLAEIHSTIKAARSRGGRGRVASDLMAAKSVEHVLLHSFERASAVPEESLKAMAYRHALGRATPEAIDAALAKAVVVRRQLDGATWLTTSKVLLEEERMVAFATETRGTCRPIAAEPRKVRDETLNESQRAVVDHILQSYDRVMLIRGGAGTGKTTLMRETIGAIEATGLSVTVLSPLSNVARQTLPAEGFKSAETIASFLRSDELQAKSKGAVLWVDEAGLLGVPTLDSLFAVAKRTGSRIVLSGDHNQHRPVDRGDAMRMLLEEGGMQAAEVTRVVRQTGDYKKACEELNRGDAKAAWETLDKMSSIVEVKGDDAVSQSHKMLAREYVQHVAGRRSVGAIAPTHRETGLVTEEIRAGLRDKKLIGKKDRDYVKLRDLHWSEAEKMDVTRYKPGMVLSFHGKSRGKTFGDKAEVMGTIGNQVLIKGKLGLVTPILLNVKHADRFTVCVEETIKVAVGDHIKITKNGRAVGDLLGFLPDRRNPLRSGRQLGAEILESLGLKDREVRSNPRRLNNGSIYRIKAFLPLSGDIVLDNGYVISKKFGHITHAYCTTSNDSQSKTVDHVLVAQTSVSFGRASSEEQFRVSVSRGKFGCKIFTDDKEKLAAEVQKHHPPLSGTALLSKADAEVLEATRRDSQRVRDAKSVVKEQTYER